MTRNFYFGKDADIVTGSANFASIITTDFASLGLTSAQCTAFGLLNTALQSAYSAAKNPPTRGPISIAAKDQAIVNMRASAITLAKIIYSTRTVDDTTLMSLGLLPRATYSPIPVPGTPPQVEVLSVSGRVAKIRVHDIDSERRGLPFGAKSANIYTFVGETAPTDARAYHFEGPTTRAMTQILFPDSVANGATVWISAQWVSNRGQMSIGSTPISFVLPGGNVGAAA